MIEIKMSKCHEAIVKIDKIADVVPFLREGWDVDSVDGLPIYGVCATCGVPVLEYEDAVFDVDGDVWHRECAGEDE